MPHPPNPRLVRGDVRNEGENSVKVPLFNSDLGGSESDGEGEKTALRYSCPYPMVYATENRYISLFKEHSKFLSSPGISSKCSKRKSIMAKWRKSVRVGRR